LVVRGGVESYGGQVLAKAQSLGMTVRQVVCDKGTLAHEIRAIAECRNADVLDLHFFVRAELSRLLYAAADGVLANSLHEPFGLVGLEAMAAGGIAYTGSTGEDYSRHMENSVVLQTEDPQEIVAYSTYLMEHPALRRSIQREAQRTAASYAWDNVIRRDLLPKLEMMCWRTGTSAHARVALDDQGRGSRSER
jgi:glycosyltransferase involved in cell wall biosynthesis